MGERLETFITSLNDHEFAVYIGYQYESLLQKSQERVGKEIEDRSLSKNQLERLYNKQLEHTETEHFCERCGSNKFFNDIDIEFQNSDHFTSEIEVKTKRCRICNHNPSKAADRSLLDKIKKFFLGDPNKIERKIKTYDWFGK